MFKRYFFLFIFILFSCQEPVTKNIYIPPEKIENIETHLIVYQNFDDIWRVLLLELENDYKIKSRDVDAGELILFFNTNEVSKYIDCGKMNEEIYVDYIDRIFGSSLNGQIRINLNSIEKNSTSLDLIVMYRFTSKETGSRWSFETNKPKSILAGNPSYGLDSYRECTSKHFLEEVLIKQTAILK